MQDIAIIIDNLVQFYSIKNDIDDLIAKKVQVDIYVFEEADQNNKQLADETANAIVKLGYVVQRVGKKHHYKVLLEPYPKVEQYTSFHNVTFDFRLKYKYSLSSAKPDPVYSVSWNVPYDGILVYSLYEYDILRAFTETHLIKPQKYNPSLSIKFDKGLKKRLLYLPTFNDVNPRDYPIIEESFKRLKNDWKLIIKVHHATEFRESERKHNEFLHQVADEIYDQSTPINDVINSADVILTGNSASVFEALYLGKPVAIFADSLTKRQLNGVKPLYAGLAQQGIVPHTDDPHLIPEVIKSALNKKTQQMVIAEEQFHSDKMAYMTLAEVVVEYLNSNTQTNEKHLLHKLIFEQISQQNTNKDALKQEVRSLTESNKRLCEKNDLYKLEINSLKSERKEYREKISEYETSHSWKVTKPLRVVGNVLKRGMKNGK